ncbi:hypothetical protein BIY37_06545 [Candidatus Brocadia sapporoensis]|uniref:diguanylate cyclase n=1 Tax=Candidatus Brocadia sapporoensis TaxID=392547 RepID=A0A1V6M060_9BACT|nr:diguanylate cyclase [Candidatus Brocadia sapporoensis]MDG6005091.1 diguanylate cyclase [Candidatus Brocadia sp.]OQD45781.1 hypothetical protein BIY37_06545 [Candidatus Brocadia sapporoensis]GJQ24617.1 MAG: hypothetical protein HBSAPP01_24070 [Candidatus Brocadia sapporoensis]
MPWRKPAWLINNTEGGDEALEVVSVVLNANMRGADRLYQYGGEGFRAILPQTGIDGARIVATKMVERIRDADFQRSKSPCQVITLSAGACSFCHSDDVTSGKI